MYVHIGENILIRSTDIITILDKQTVEASPISLEFMEKQKKLISNIKGSIYKSIVITKDTIYLSPIASNTLKKRSMQLMDHEY
ncbi:extracellular matrix regulator RemB [Bacillus sp. B1-b2]|uniref:extracellular matrix regulator RemB n=1 Tax=Bacillus sp. B1-b2 TaxID=2653201 RepID=UPI0012619797|nr:extracellular matrix/biofilm biosynthesis regulator RemA family protein [Bacillus sp. B1-b2]KAB7665309.1 DUF370 domain-containing protein [Bacillus sp. B1-b2]